MALVSLIALIFVLRPNRIDGNATASRTAREFPSKNFDEARRFEARIICTPLRKIIPDISLKGIEGSDVQRLRNVIRSMSKSADFGRHTPDAFWVDGVVNLISGKLEIAIEQLKEAARIGHNDPRVLNDLAATYLTLALAGKDNHAYLLALSTADRAVSSDSRLNEAQYNLALTLQSIFLLDRARDEWEKYLELDPVSPWADKVKARITELSAHTSELSWKKAQQRLYPAIAAGDLREVRDLVQAFPRSVMNYVLVDVLGRWSAALMAGNEGEAREALRCARILGEELSSLGDSLVVDAISNIERMGSNSGQLYILARGYHEYSVGRNLYKKGQYNSAVRSLHEAMATLGTGSPLFKSAKFYEASTYQQKGQYSEALMRLTNISGIWDVKRYPIGAGEVWWARGLAEITLGNPSESIDAYREALRHFDSVHDVEQVSLVHNLLSNSYDLVGAPGFAWNHRVRTLRLISRISDPMSLRNIFFVAAFSALNENETNAALYFQDEAVKSAQKSDDPRLLAEALLWRGKVLFLLGRNSSAVEAFQIAQKSADLIIDPGARLLAMANIAAALGETHINDNPGAARLELKQALDFYIASGFHYYRVRTRLALADVELSLQNVGVAERYLELAIKELELVRASITDGYLRAQYLDQVELAFEKMSSVQLRERRKVGRALDFLERGRCRLLLDSLAVKSPPHGRSNTIAPLTFSSIQEKISEDAVILEYGLLGGRLVVWILRPDSVDAEEVGLDEVALEAMVESFRQAIKRDEAERVRLLGRQLYDLLIPYSVSRDPRIKDLVIIPEAVLSLMPFSALIAPKNSYLVESYCLATAPSASVYAHALESVDGYFPDWRKSKVLAVAGPGYGKNGLQSLIYSEQEAARVARISSDSVLLEKSASTRTNVLSAGSYAQLIHLATHVQINDRTPWLSSFVLAPERDRSKAFNLLSARDLYSAQFPEARLVVLAGCATATGMTSKSEGVFSLARPFLVAGVPSVVASLWPIEDIDAARFFEVFYENLEKVRDPSRALRLTQLSLLKGRDKVMKKPSSWAAFEMIGAGLNQED
ncbi:MAG TPA: CHAT domain-containing protein [Thermoanaerobaculia bacterium]|nr:CHAT domain-containing protein [Thermoanaerobaculia bacterium]